MTRKVTLLTLGTRGDLDPYLAVAVELKDKFNEIVVAALPEYEDIVTKLGFTFYPIHYDVRKVLSDRYFSDLVRSRKILRLFSYTRKIVGQYLPRVLEESLAACSNADVIIFTDTTPWGLDIAEKLKVPVFHLSVSPYWPTKHLPLWSIGPNITLWNLFTYHVGLPLIWSVFEKSINTFREKKLKLNKISILATYRKRKKIISLLGVSPSVFVKPSDWPKTFHVTGYWNPPSTNYQQPPLELINFLKSGSTPVCVYFGSMMFGNETTLQKKILSGISLSGERAIIISGWEPQEINNNFHYIKNNISFEYLLPKISLLIHHGGPGTIFMALKNKIPSIIVPYIPDQFFLAKWLKIKKLNKFYIPYHRLKPEILAKTIRDLQATPVTDSELLSQISKKLLSEDGVKVAVKTIMNNLQSQESHQ